MSGQNTLERWETLPLWALGLSNGVNIALWYVLSMLNIDAPDLALRLPSGVNAVLPIVIVVGGIAAAISLDGVLVATLAGVRQGRKGWGSWLTIVGAGGFSAAIAYAIHGGMFQEWAWLHMAQAGVLVLYNWHLSQPKSVDSNDTAPARRDSASGRSKTPLAQQDAPKPFTCKQCGQGGFLTATEVKTHQRLGCVAPSVTVSGYANGATNHADTERL